MNIAIIGAGPRGLSLCERLIAQASINQQSLSLTLIIPIPLEALFGKRINRKVCYSIL